MTVLTVLCGIPGAGKTTWARAHAGAAVVLSNDAVRTRRNVVSPTAFMAGMLRRADRLLRDGCDVVVDACSTQPAWRARWVALARRHGAVARLVVLRCPLGLAMRRQAARRSSVPKAAMERYAVEFGVMLVSAPAEGWDEIVVAA